MTRPGDRTAPALLPFDAPAPIAPEALPNNAEARLEWLALARIDGVGPVAFRKLLQRFGAAGAALRARPDAAAARDRAAAELAAGAAIGARLSVLGGRGYPRALWALPDAPPAIWIKGDAGRLNEPAVAVVGARNASAASRRLAALIAEELAEAGVLVVSGLARGIDAAAHAAAVARPGRTAAVLAGGLDRPSPPENVALYERILADGVALSEAPPTAPPQPRHFLRRNRLISGLARAVVVVEASERSGSLVTARFAVEQGRDVMAAPGHPLEPRSIGGNALIREGATLIRSGADVLEALAGFGLRRSAPGAHAARPEPRFDAGPPERALEPEIGDPQTGDASPQTLSELLLELISQTPVSMDALVRESGAPTAAVAQTLLDLELRGVVERRPGGLFAAATQV